METSEEAKDIERMEKPTKPKPNVPGDRGNVKGEEEPCADTIPKAIETGSEIGGKPPEKPKERDARNLKIDGIGKTQPAKTNDKLRLVKTTKRCRRGRECERGDCYFLHPGEEEPRAYRYITDQENNNSRRDGKLKPLEKAPTNGGMNKEDEGGCERNQDKEDVHSKYDTNNKKKHISSKDGGRRNERAKTPKHTNKWDECERRGGINKDKEKQRANVKEDK